MSRTLSIIGLLSVFSCVRAQDLYFYQSNQSLLAMNPSFAGTNGGLRNQFSYRIQCPELPFSPVTYNNALDGYVKQIKAGIGLSLTDRSSGYSSYRNQSVGISYAQHISVSDGKLKIIPSLEWRYCKSSVDLASLHFGDMINPYLPEKWMDSTVIPSASVRYGDLTAGLMIQHGSLFIGASFAHINHPDIGHFSESLRLPGGFNLYVSRTYTVGTKCLLQGLVRIKGFSNFYSANMAVNSVLFNYIMLGVGYWRGDQYTASAGYRGKYCSLAIEYDIIVSNLSGDTAGSWEFHWSMNLRPKEKRNLLTSFEEM